MRRDTGVLLVKDGANIFSWGGGGKEQVNFLKGQAQQLHLCQ